MTCSGCAGDYENPDRSAEATDMRQMHTEDRTRKVWRHPIGRQKPNTYFDNYSSRLAALAERHNVPLAAFKALIEDAFGKCDCRPAEGEAKIALLKLAKMKVGPCELNFLFGYHVIKDSDL